MFAINIENLETLKYHIFFKKHQIFLLFTVNMVMNIKKTFKEEESMEILRILSLITNIEDYRKLYNHL